MHVDDKEVRSLLFMDARLGDVDSSRAEPHESGGDTEPRNGADGRWRATVGGATVGLNGMQVRSRLVVLLLARHFATLAGSNANAWEGAEHEDPGNAGPERLAAAWA